MVRFDAKALHEALDARRRERGMTWERVAAEMGVSAATIARAMVGWLGVPVETFVRESNR